MKNMKKKIFLFLLVFVSLFTITGCSNDKEKVEESFIKITSKDKEYYTTFKSTIDKFVQTNPKYNFVDNEELGIFMSFQYIESSKEAYDYAKTHNFLGYEYSKDEIKEYKWNNYSGYTFDVKEKEMNIRILLNDDKDNSVVLSIYIGDKHTKDLNLIKDFDSEEFQKFFNTIEFINN